MSIHISGQRRKGSQRGPGRKLEGEEAPWELQKQEEENWGGSGRLQPGRKRKGEAVVFGLGGSGPLGQGSGGAVGLKPDCDK